MSDKPEPEPSSEEAKADWRGKVERENRKLRLIGKDKVFVDEIAPHVPDTPEDYGTELELFERVKEFVKSVVYLEDEDIYTVLTGWILCTWRIEDTDITCYLLVLAPKGHGKSKLLETLEQVVRRPLNATFATRAGVVRSLDKSNATLLLDEAENYINPMARYPDYEMMAVLNAYRRGQYVILIDEVKEKTPDGKTHTVRKPVAMDPFSFKVIASRKDVFDTLEDRAVQIIMLKSTRKAPPIDLKEAEHLRAQLMQYRLDHLEKPTPLRVEAMPDAKYPRLTEILEPLYAATPEKYKGTYKRLIEREDKLRLDRLRESYEFHVLEALCAIVDISDIDGDLILTEAVTDAYNSKYPSKKPKTTRSIGGILQKFGFTSAERFETVEISGGRHKQICRRGYLLKWQLLERLKNEYALDAEPELTPETPKNTSLTSFTSSHRDDSPPSHSGVDKERQRDTHTTVDVNDVDDVNFAEKLKMSRFSRQGEGGS